jgi:DNA polymerase III alpha subunit (gram-positive type)
MIGSELLRFDKQRKYLCWDLETTGLNLAYSLPWQISFSLFTLDKVILEQDFYIWWDNLPMSAGAAQVTGFNPNDYRNRAKEPDLILRTFESYLYDPEVYSVAHNQLSYDVMIHAIWRRKLGFKEDFSYLDRAFDTVALSKAWKKGAKPESNNLLCWQYRMMSVVEKGLKTNLAQMGRDFDIPFNEQGLHNALADIRLNREVFKKLLWQLDI